MTVYELIRRLSAYPPDVKVVIIPQKRNRWDKKNAQSIEYIFGRDLRIDTGNGEPMVEICGGSNEIL